MAVFARFKRNRKATFVCIIGALLFCVWIFVQKQTPRSKVVTYHQQINESFPNSSLFTELKEVSESDFRLWQRKFYSSLASATKLHASENVTKWKALALYTSYNQSYLSNINQITLPCEPKNTVNTTSQNRLLQFLETASCQPITPDVVLYNRIFKTGSESVGAFFYFSAAMMNYSYTNGRYGRVSFDK